MQLDVTSPATVERWRPLVLWLLCIPLFVVAWVYSIIAGLLAFLGWFAALFTARLPESFADLIAAYLRFSWRVQAYLLALTTRYPSFGLPGGRADPGDDPASFVVGPPTPLSRLKVFFRFILVIPHLVVLWFLGIAQEAVMLVAWFAVLILGRWPDGMRSFVVGVFRWQWRVNAWFMLLTDEYPPFALEP
ncbi:MAG: DUF4389 domain-containing protein [Acidimicrobiaceae bacterium]|nr:DUF4389 domain-containing protein [Acidimicrobiaceae bacterium]